MWKIHLKTSLRNLLRHRSNTLINLLSLSIGITVSVLIFAILNYQYSFDAEQSRAERIYRVNVHSDEDYGTNFSATTPQPMAAAIRAEYPQVEMVTRTLGPTSVRIKKGEEMIRQDRVLFVDEYFTSVFDQQWIAGDPATALSVDYGVVLTESAAERLFGEQEPMGQKVRFDDRVEGTVTGVVVDPGLNTNLPYTMLASAALIEEIEPFYVLDDWEATSIGLTWLLLPEGTEEAAVEEALQGIITKYADARYHESTSLHLLNLRAAHTNDRYGTAMHYTLPSATIYALLAIGLIFLLTCTINFVNLATAQAVQRFKEMGIKKIYGSSRSSLIRQLFMEMSILTLTAAFFSLWMSELLLHEVNQLLSLVAIDMGLGLDSVLFALFLALLLTAVAGSYPVLVMTRAKATENLGQQVRMGRDHKVLLRKTLLTVQFTFSQILLIVVLVFLWQFYYIENKSQGYDADHVLTFNNFVDGSPSTIAVVRQELMAHPDVEEVSFGTGGPNAIYAWGTTVTDPLDSDKTRHQIDYKHAELNYKKLFGLEMLSGEWFGPEDYREGAEERVVINETLLRRIGLDARVAPGYKLEINGAYLTVAGVVKDFHNTHFREEIMPCAIEGDRFGYQQGFIKYRPGSYQEVAEHLERIAASINPDYLPTISSYRDELAADYTLDRTLFSFINFVAIMAILVSCLGLYSLTAFVAQQKTKEIGIRKVVGAGTSSIVRVISRDFVLTIVIAFVLATPVAGYVAGIWLDRFVYHVSPGPQLYLLALLLTLLIAAVTVGYRVWVAASINPVQSLRNE